MCLFSWMVCCLKVKGSHFQREAKRFVNVCEEKAFQQVIHTKSLMKKGIYCLLHRKWRWGFIPALLNMYTFAFYFSLSFTHTHSCTPKHTGMSIHAHAPDLPVIFCVNHTVGVAVNKLWYFDCNHSSRFLRFLIISWLIVLIPWRSVFTLTHHTAFIQLRGSDSESKQSRAWFWHDVALAFQELLLIRTEG